MTRIGNCMLTLLVLLTLGVIARAQDTLSRESSRATGPAVTISVTEGGVRFAALGSFGKMRLEVFDADGMSLFNSDFGAASVRDWVLDDKDGQRVPDGTYLCVITIRDLSGRFSTKQGSVVLQGGQPSLKLPEGESVEVIEPDKSLARVTDPPNTALTLIGHDGRNGQVVNTRGALTFRFGDFFGGKDHELMRLTPEGNLGLGVKSPQAKLDVAGTIRARGIEFANGTVQTTGLSGRTDAQGNIVPAASGSGTQNNLAKWMDNSGTLGDSVVTESSGNVGIGTTAPVSQLHLAGPNGVSAITLNTPGNQSFRFQTIPGIPNWGALTLNSNYTFPSGWLLDDPTTNGYFFKLETRGGNASGVLNGLWLYRIPSGPGFHTDETPVFGVSNGTAYFAGNVGVGTLNPQSPLDVNGNLNVTGNATVSGNIAAKYQDIAEWTAARTNLPAGTVVSLDTLKPNSVMASNKAYDTRVAGVVSAQPGVILGEGGPNRVLVATNGRVKVRVNANRSPIHIGDLLVTSNTPGVAMKSAPFHLHGQIMHRPGTIIGKALEPLAKGQGEILVLLSLQ